MENPKTGELMSKSRSTGVFLGTSANDMFGQVMAQPDEMIDNFLRIVHSYRSWKSRRLCKCPIRAMLSYGWPRKS